MADRLNDTDPQSPVALQSRSEPPPAAPRPAVVVAPSQSVTPEETPARPLPASSSATIDELIDGITGPRPPPSRREGGESGGRAVPSSHPTPPDPGIVAARRSSGPPAKRGAVPERDVPTGPKGSIDPKSLRPVSGQERTVYTGRRALVQKAVAVILSGAAVSAMMIGVMRWKEGRAARAAASGGEALPPTAPAIAATAAAANLVLAPASPPLVVAPSATAAPSASAVSSASPPKRVTPAAPPKHAKPSPSGSLDDLNREIVH